MEVYGKRSQEKGPKAEKDKTERATGLGTRTREITEKWDQTDSPEISDRGEDIRNPPASLRGVGNTTQQSLSTQHASLSTGDCGR